MSAEILSEHLRPVDDLDALIARHGLIRVILVLPAAVWQRHAGADGLTQPIPAHLARDIGLVPEAVRKMHWDYC